LYAEAAVPLSSSISVTREGEKENKENGIEEEKKKEKEQEKRKNQKSVGTAFRSLLSFFAYKICRTGKKKVQKTSIEREARRLQR
jgi:nucleosome binding factor SPN SPT16 subunit